MSTNDFEHAFHRVAERHERIWVFISLVLLTVLLIGSMFYVVIDYGAVTRGGEFAATPAVLADDPRFRSGSVVQTGPDSYTVYVVGRIWSWAPADIHVKQGATVTFHVTSADVLHGFEVQGTTLNATAVPGAVGTVSYRFDHAGTYHIICNEFCGIEHHAMTGRIIVDPRQAS